jgi:hypothetical protein
MYGGEINKYMKKCVKLIISKNYKEMHGQQNIKETNKLIISVGELLALLLFNTTPCERIFISVTVDVPGRIKEFTFLNFFFSPKYFCFQTRRSFPVHKAK